MKTMTVREVQHNLRKVLRWIEDGELVAVSRRNRIVAKIVPPAGRPPISNGLISAGVSGTFGDPSPEENLRAGSSSTKEKNGL